MYRILKEVDKVTEDRPLVEEMFVEGYHLMEGWKWDEYVRSHNKGAYYFGKPLKALAPLLRDGVKKYEKVKMFRSPTAACYDAHMQSKKTGAVNPMDFIMAGALLELTHARETDEELVEKFPTITDLIALWSQMYGSKKQSSLEKFAELRDWHEEDATEKMAKALSQLLAQAYGIRKPNITGDTSMWFASPQGKVSSQLASLVSNLHIEAKYHHEPGRLGEQWAEESIQGRTMQLYWERVVESAIELVMHEKGMIAGEYELPPQIVWDNGLKLGELTQKDVDEGDYIIVPGWIREIYRVVFDPNKGFRVYTKFHAWKLTDAPGIKSELIRGLVEWTRAMARTYAGKKLKMGKRIKQLKVKIDPQGEEEVPMQVVPEEVPES